MPAKTEYLWNTRAEYARNLDNLRQAGETLEAVQEEMSNLKANYDFPEGTDPEELLGKIAEAREILEGVVSTGTVKVASFHEALMSKENR